MPEKSKPPANPYSITLNGKGSYTFNTDQDANYFCKFLPANDVLGPVLDLYDIEVFEFVFEKFDPEPPRRMYQDPRVSDTIQRIMHGFLSEDLRVMLYLCDSSDGRAEKRHRLFKRWYENFGDGFHNDNLKINFEGDYEPVYGSMITTEDFPHRDVLKREIFDKAEGLVLGKYGQ